MSSRLAYFIAGCTVGAFAKSIKYFTLYHFPPFSTTYYPGTSFEDEDRMSETLAVYRLTCWSLIDIHKWSKVIDNLPWND